MKIKPLTLDRIEEVKDFLLSIIKDDFGYEFDPQWHWDIVDLTKVYLASESCFFIAEKDGKVVGTIAARPFDRTYPELLGLHSVQTTLSIWRHYIRKDLRGQGIGTALYKEVEKFAREHRYSEIYLHTQRTIPGSLEYWISRGFEITVDLHDVYQTVHMVKKLK